MIRVQVLLSEDQDRRLEALARRLATSKSALIREGIEAVLQRRQAAALDPLLELVGQAGRVGRKKVSRCHDACLAGGKVEVAALEGLLDKAEESTRRGNRALDQGLARIATGMARIDRIERSAARRRKSDG